MADFTGVDRKVLSSTQEAAAPQAPVQQEPEEQGFDLGQMVQDVVAAPGDLLMQGAGAVKGLLENADQGLQDLQADDSVGSEILRSVGGAAGNLDAKVSGATEFAGDAIGSIGDAIDPFDGPREESDTVWSDQYEYAQYDLTGAQTKTVLGGIVQEGLAFAMGGAATGGVSSLVGAGGAATAATALASDFVLDYFSNAEGGNISNLIQDGPLANSLSEALAHSEEDNPHWRRLKNSVEGLFPGMGVIGVQKLYKGLRAGNAVKGSVDAKVAAAKSVASEAPEGNYAKAAAEENTNISGRPATELEPEGKPATFEPQERAVQMDKDPDINSSASSFWEDDAPGGGRSLIDEVDVEQIKTQEGLRDFISQKAPEVDVDQIATRLSRQPAEYTEEVLRSVANFVNTKDLAELDNLRFTNTLGIKGVDAGGAVVFDTMIKSATERVGVLAKNIIELDDLNAATKTQADQLLNRLEGLVNIKKEATQFSSKNLENWKQVPPELRRAVEADREKVGKIFGELRTGLNSADPVMLRQAKRNLRGLAIGLNFAKGDPKLQMQFVEGLASVGWKRLSGVMINSLLSGGLTHVRNIAGNVTAMGERTLVSRPIGRLMDGDVAGALRSFHALGSFQESLSEALKVGRNSYESTGVITTPSSKMVNYSAEMSRDVQLLIDTASNKGEKVAAHVVKTYVDLGGHAWFQWPGKALQVGDDFTKSLLARMELRVQAADEAAKIAKQGDPRSAKEIRQAEYIKLVDQKVAPNGKILDHDLINVVEDAAFQRPLQGWVKDFGEALQKIPGGRTFFMPFFTTGANITRYGLQGTPVGAFMGEYDQVVRQGMGSVDQAQILKGRVAAGTTLATAVGFLASEDLATGYGPAPGPDRDLWLKTHQPHSFRAGSDSEGKPRWIEHRAIPGMSMIWSVVSDSVNLTQSLAEGDADHVLSSLPFFIASSLDSQPMFQGVMNLSNFLDFESWPKDAVPETMLDLTNRALGGAQMRRAFEQAIATSMHDYANWRDKYLAKVTGGLTTAAGITEPIAKTDVLNGEPILNKYQSNRFNLINPFTTTTSNNDPLVIALGDLDYTKIADMVPSNVGGVPVEPLEEELLRKAIYAGGKFRKALESDLGEDGIFWEEYNEWRTAWDAGMYPDGRPVEPKEDAAWHKRLDRVTGKFISDAKRELMNGSSEVSVNFRATKDERRAKLSTGSANINPNEQERYQDSIQNFYKK